MHILEIPSFFPPLGGEFCIEQSKALQALGHEVRILSCNQLGLTIDKKAFLTARNGLWEECIDGINVLRKNMRGIPKSIKCNQERWCRIVIKMFDKYVERYGKPDILHAHCCQWAGVAARMISEQSGIPFVITEHLSSTLFTKVYGEGWTKHIWAKELLAETYKKANCVVPVSAELVDNLAPFFGKEYKWKVVSNIIDVDFFAYRKRQHSEKFRFCCLAVGNVYVKGYDILAKAWQNMDNAELHIAGRGTDREEVTSLFKECSNVVFHGGLNKEEVRQLLYDCEALVLASRSEAQPLVLLEAMSTGIPVVSTDVVPLSERIENACVVVPKEDAEALFNGMKKAVDIKCNRSFSEKVRLLASPQTVGKQLEKIFLSVL